MNIKWMSHVSVLSHSHLGLSPRWPGSQPGSVTGLSIHYPSASPKLGLEFHCIKLQERSVHGLSWPLLSSLAMASNPEALEAGFGPHRKPIRYKNSTAGTSSSWHASTHATTQEGMPSSRELELPHPSFDGPSWWGAGAC